MGVSPESISVRDNLGDFRAPPPSPVASGRRSCVTNDDVLTEFLETSLRVPDLVLPDKIFPKQRFIDNPARIDFGSLTGPPEDRDSALKNMVESISRVGCFQLVNFGIQREILNSAMNAAGGIFQLSPEKRAAVARSPECRYGFEEIHGEEESELVEEFVWYRDGSLKSEMERIWPQGYSNFRGKMIHLVSDIEKVAEKIFSVLWDNFLSKLSVTRTGDLLRGPEVTGPVCCLFKHRPSTPTDLLENSLRYDVIKMLIRANDYSHVFELHLFDGPNEFQVYSKKGWVSFCPDKGSLIVTVGDQFQALSGGQYKHVVGRPVFKGEKEDRISMAFLYAPPPAPPVGSGSGTEEEHSRSVISIRQQAILALVLTLLYQFLVYVYKNF